MDKPTGFIKQPVSVPLHRPPRYRSISCFRPVSGLMSRITPKSAPSHAVAQWRVADGLLIYRCGGSAGIALNNIRSHQLPV